MSCRIGCEHGPATIAADPEVDPGLRLVGVERSDRSMPEAPSRRALPGEQERPAHQLDVTIIFSDGDLVADRLEANGIRVDNDQPINWIENHIYQLRDGRIAELWPAGGLDLTT